MKVKILTIGKTSFPALVEMENEYQKRLKHYIPLERLDLPDVKNARSLSHEQIKVKEGELFLTKINDDDTLVLLDEHGKLMDSVGFSNFIGSRQDSSTKSLVFCIGGAFGFSDAVKSRANELVSLSKMTFSHQLVRTIFLEQLYRACTIRKGEKYHHS
ncbi:MAG: 23S rRNA (pseudouridine(1915)-N(3))-methyltransferase RlmH [Flavobacteriia bacterium]|jgi:23S rRNA (pseudouridine1915-N3)-methyltransferase